MPTKRANLRVIEGNRIRGNIDASLFAELVKKRSFLKSVEFVPFLVAAFGVVTAAYAVSLAFSGQLIPAYCFAGASALGVFSIIAFYLPSRHRKNAELLRDFLGMVQHECEYVARNIEARLEDSTGEGNSKRQRKRTLLRSSEEKISLLSRIRYALLLRSQKIRVFLSKNPALSMKEGILIASAPLALFSSASETPDFVIPLESMARKVESMLRELEDESADRDYVLAEAEGF